MVGNHLLDKNSAAVRKNIENHAFTDESGDEYGASRFGGFADYFHNKNIKLQNRDAQLRSSAKDKPQFFKGVVVYVLGYTQPSLNDLHDMLVQHGAGWLQYLGGKTMATHIICSSIPPRKIVDLANYRVVKPAWVVDSVAAGRMLSWTEYRLIDEGPKQRTIKFDAGKMLSSQPRQQTPQGYREQTENSFYTSQLKKFSSPAQPKTPFKSPTIVNDDIEALDDDMSVDLLQAPPSSKPEPLALAEPDGPSDERSDTPPSQAPLEAAPEARPTTPDIAEPKNSEPGEPAEMHTAKPMTSEEHNARLLADPKMRKASTANPDFLKQYYSESRLHHLSTWKAQLKSRMQSLAAEKGPAKKLAKRPAGSRRYIMHVDFDSFFCAVSLKKAPEYRDKPAVVAHGNGSGSEIASCNYPARNFGVKNGMWMKHALELCPDLHILPYDFPGYEEASRQFYDAILEIGGVVQSVSIDEALVDVTDIVLAEAGSKGVGISEGSIWREQEKVDQMASKLRERIKEKTDCQVSIGIGGNILLAKVALRRAKPAGQYQIKPEQVLDFLGELNVEDLPGVARSIGAKLEELGIKFVKDIRQTSKERLISALGPKTGEKLWEYSRGIDRTEVGEQPIRKSVSADVNWGIRFVNQEEAEEFVRSLSQELERRLLSEGVKGKHLTMKIMRRAADAPLDPPKHLGHGKCDTFNKSVSFGVATNSGDVIGKEAVAILRSYKFSPGDLRGLGIQMTKLEPLKPCAAQQGSQKKLSFGAAANASTKKRKAEAIDDEPQSPGEHSTERDEKDPITADPLTPRKPKVHPALHLARAGEADEKAKTPLNVKGTQFIMPSQLDPSVLAELPEDIRTTLVDQMKAQPSRRPASIPPQPISRKASPNHAEIPPDIDVDVFNALPPSMQAEVLASYRRDTAQAGPSRPPLSQGGGGGGGGQTLLPQSPRKDRIINRPVDRLRTPTKRGRGRPPAYLKEKERDLKAGLRQASLITAARSPDRGQVQGPSVYSRQPSAEVDLPPLDPNVLSELPEEVRREVIEEHARQRRQLERQAQATAAAAQQQQQQQQQEHSRHVHLIAVDIESAKHYLLRRRQAGNNNFKNNPRLFPNQQNPANQAYQDDQQIPSPIAGGRHHPLFGPPPNWGRTNRDSRRIHWPGPPAKATLKSAALPAGGQMKVTDAAAVRTMIRSWYVSTEKQGGPSLMDMEALEEYLYKVITLERDMEKARGLVRWLEWWVEGGGEGSAGEHGDGDGDREVDEEVAGVAGCDENVRRDEDGDGNGFVDDDDGIRERISEKKKGKMTAKEKYTWPEAVEVIKASVQEAMKERGLEMMDLS